MDRKTDAQTDGHTLPYHVMSHLRVGEWNTDENYIILDECIDTSEGHNPHIQCKIRVQLIESRHMNTY